MVFEKNELQRRKYKSSSSRNIANRHEETRAQQNFGNPQIRGRLTPNVGWMKFNNKFAEVQVAN
jgi:hypothetical protein